MPDIVNERILLNARQIEIITTRLAAQILENIEPDTDLAIIGLQPRGVYFSEILKDKIIELGFGNPLKYAELDTTFHRDDFRRVTGLSNFWCGARSTTTQRASSVVGSW